MMRGTEEKTTQKIRNLLVDFRDWKEDELERWLEALLLRIVPADEAAGEKAAYRWSKVAKPLHSLGILEEDIRRIAAMQGKGQPDISKKALVLFCADNGVVEEGVTQTGQEVTAAVTRNFTRGESCSCLMAQRAGADVFPVDIGVACEMDKLGTVYPLIDRKIRRGTRNFTKEPAMSRREVITAILTGADLVRVLKRAGYGILATGEMGIGNTTTSSAVAASLLGMDAETVTGRGAGLSTEGLLRKKTVIANALTKYGFDGWETSDAFEVLCTVGGFDIAAIAGAFIGGAMYGVPIVIDGLISVVGALVASRLCPASREVMIPSHMSKEPCTVKIMEELKLSPIIHGELALGEGTGAALLFPMLDMAEAVYRNDETFDKLAIPAYQSYEE